MNFVLTATPSLYDWLLFFFFTSTNQFDGKFLIHALICLVVLFVVALVLKLDSGLLLVELLPLTMLCHTTRIARQNLKLLV